MECKFFLTFSLLEIFNISNIIYLLYLNINKDHISRLAKKLASILTTITYKIIVTTKIMMCIYCAIKMYFVPKMKFSFSQI